MSGIDAEETIGKVTLTIGEGTSALRWRGPGTYTYSTDSGIATVQIELPSGINANLREHAMSHAENITRMSSFGSSQERADEMLRIAEQIYRFLLAA